MGISEKEKIYARKTDIVNLSNAEYNNFMNTNHIQQTSSASIRYGLMYNNEVVAAIGFKHISCNNYNLVRYATSVNVVGGFSKLLKHFKNNVVFDEIFTFADLRWSTHNNIYVRH